MNVRLERNGGLDDSRELIRFVVIQSCVLIFVLMSLELIRILLIKTESMKVALEMK